MILVKLIQPGREVREYNVTDNPTVTGLLNQAGLTFAIGSVLRSHTSLSAHSRLYDGDMITYATPTKGNQMFEVKVVIIGSATPIVSLPAEEGMTIDAVLDQLPDENKARIYNADGKPTYEYRIGDSEALSGSHVLSRPPNGVVRLILSTRTKGNE
jgi:hypothetical protein